MQLYLACKEIAGGSIMGNIIAAEDQGHDQADANPKDERQNEPRHGQIHADDTPCVDERQDVGPRVRRKER